MIKEKPLKIIQEENFKIIKSKKYDQRNTLISPDIATCPDCIEELFNPNDRRYLYPFINCTNCGPRYTIINDIPYDRPNTSMSEFKMCNQCENEYSNPEDRRFHAQPNACSVCGPHIEFMDSTGKTINGEPIINAIHLLKKGLIIAIKGLGGFHIAVDACDNKAVNRLRKRKHRFEKPLALMVSDLESIQKIAFLNTREKKLLNSPQKPIVLCRSRKNNILAKEISLDNDYFGVMLPYSPLHAILFKKGAFKYLVMTSANISEEPICYQNNECLIQMKNIADYYLINNRDIYTRCDDSVARIYRNNIFFIRRSRGYTPRPVILTRRGKPVLAVGAQLKNVICLTKGNQAFLSQHIGDLENLDTLNYFENTIAYLQRLFEIKPRVIIHDLHPDYLSTKWVKDNTEIPGFPVQHHYAHILSVMAEHRIENDVIGLSLDGTGYGSDGNIWGGEILTCNLKSFYRYGHFKYIPMPGGEYAIKEPWRMACSYLYHYLPDGLDIAQKLFPTYINDIPIIKNIIDKKINAPLTSSCGRLFDAIAAILGIRDVVTYEGQAAILLESLAEKQKSSIKMDIGCFNIRNEGETFIIDSKEIIQNIVRLKFSGYSNEQLSYAFHKSLVTLFIKVACKIRDITNINRVALSGGCFQNMILLSALYNGLESKGFAVYTNSEVPVNDGGISLGQAYWGMMNC